MLTVSKSIRISKKFRLKNKLTLDYTKQCKKIIFISNVLQFSSTVLVELRRRVAGFVQKNEKDRLKMFFTRKISGFFFDNFCHNGKLR